MKRIPLLSLLRNHYRPTKANGESSSPLHIRFAINSIEQFAGRELTAADLNEELFTAWLKDRFDTVDRRRVKRDRAALLAFWMFAHERGEAMAPPLHAGPLSSPRKSPRDPSLPAAQSVPLRELLWKHFRPRRSLSVSRARRLGAWITALEDFLGREPMTADLNENVVTGWLADRLNTRAREYVLEDRCDLNLLWRFAVANGFDAAPYVKVRTPKQAGPRRKARPLEGDLKSRPLSLYAVLWQDYVAAHPDMGRQRSLRFHWAIASLEQFAGRSLTAQDLSVELLDRWFEARRYEVHLSTVRDNRTKLLLLWRFAAAKGWSPSPPMEISGLPAANRYDAMDAELEGLNLRQLLWERYYPLRQRLKRHSAEQIEWTIRGLYRFHGRAILAAELSEEVVLPYITQASERLSLATAARVSRHLMALWKFAYRKSLCQNELPRDYEPPRPLRKIPTAWTIEEFQRIVAECFKMPGMVGEIRAADWWGSLLLWLYDSGARCKASLSIRPTEMDLGKREAVLRAEAAKTGLEQLIDFSPETAEAIGRHFQPDRDLVWPWPHHPRTLRNQFKRILKAAGVSFGRGVAFHQVRRTTATQVVKALGWDRGRLALGHTAEDVTRRYVDVRQLDRPRYLLPSPVPAGLPRLTSNVIDVEGGAR